MSQKALPASLTIHTRGDESEITITTPARDLMRDTIDPMRMDVERYLNGTRAVNFAHDHGRLPVAKTISLTKTTKGIRARFRWLDANPEAAIVRGVFEEGVLGASVEFVPVEIEPNQAGGYHYAKSVLTGWALTGSPANPECVRMMKSLGFPRDDGVLALAEDDEADRVTVDPVDVVVALHAAVGRQVRDEVRRQSRGLLGLGHEPVVFVLADEPDADEDTILIDPERVKAAVTQALGVLVNHEVRQAVNALRGRVD